jgi:hypothetical protein
MERQSNWSTPKHILIFFNTHVLRIFTPHWPLCLLTAHTNSLLREPVQGLHCTVTNYLHSALRLKSSHSGFLTGLTQVQISALRPVILNEVCVFFLITSMKTPGTLNSCTVLLFQSIPLHYSLTFVSIDAVHKIRATESVINNLKLFYLSLIKNVLTALKNM